jgi:hypothetical protein
MYRGRLWTMRQYAGMGNAEESNRRYKYLLSQGTTGLSCGLRSPTQIGLDSDSPLAMGEVGKVGVAIDSIEDMMRLFDGINLEKISTSMTIPLQRIYETLERKQVERLRTLRENRDQGEVAGRRKAGGRHSPRHRQTYVSDRRSC